jgi:hypothetical protein
MSEVAFSFKGMMEDNPKGKVLNMNKVEVTVFCFCF